MTAPATIDVSGTDKIPFPRLVAVEMRKMGDTRAGKWLLIAILVITALVVGLILAFAPENVKNFEGFLGASATPQGFLLPVLGVLLVTSEWGQRAALNTFTLVPHREKIIGAKVIAAVLLGLAAIVVAIAVAAVAALVAGNDNVWGAYGVGDTGKFALLQTLGILQGLAFGMLLLNSAAAIVAYFVLPIAFNIVTSIIAGLRDVQPWIDPGTAQTPLFGGSALTGEEWAQLATTTLIWIVLPGVVGAWRVMRSEVK
ncbi:MAG TPA: ABC transporter permease [Marmoricola sp.]|nr:ABC transporter permease [Marmoricola sp.]